MEYSNFHKKFKSVMGLQMQKQKSVYHPGTYLVKRCVETFTDPINIKYMFIEGLLWVRLYSLGIEQWVNQEIKNLPVWSLCFSKISKYMSWWWWWWWWYACLCITWHCKILTNKKNKVRRENKKYQGHNFM